MSCLEKTCTVLSDMGGLFQRSDKRVLCLDPGSSHLACGIFALKPEKTTLIWNYMFRVDHDPMKLAAACKLMYQMCQTYSVGEVLLEFQAPIGICHANHWNAYIEGALAGILSFQGLMVHSFQPSVAKRMFKLATGNYADNKRLAFAWAKARCPQIDSHHLADCFVMAEYWRTVELAVDPCCDECPCLSPEGHHE
jgi:hypothetical protein